MCWIQGFRAAPCLVPGIPLISLWAVKKKIAGPGGVQKIRASKSGSLIFFGDINKKKGVKPSTPLSKPLPWRPSQTCRAR